LHDWKKSLRGSRNVVDEVQEVEGVAVDKAQDVGGEAQDEGGWSWTQQATQRV